MAGRIARVSAELLSIDPVTAARRLLGVGAHRPRSERHDRRGGGLWRPADGPWPDAASHSFRGPGGRNAVMFGPAGRMYTYRSHGIHVCANVMCATAGVAGAVLLRAAAVESGLDVARARRGDAARRPRWRVARGICAQHSESRWTTTESICSTRTVRSGSRSATSSDCVERPRVGVSQAADRPWRFWLAGRPEVSAYRRSPRAPAPGDSD